MVRTFFITISELTVLLRKNHVFRHLYMLAGSKKTQNIMSLDFFLHYDLSYDIQTSFNLSQL